MASRTTIIITSHTVSALLTFPRVFEHSVYRGHPTAAHLRDNSLVTRDLFKFSVKCIFFSYSIREHTILEALLEGCLLMISFHTPRNPSQRRSQNETHAHQDGKCLDTQVVIHF